MTNNQMQELLSQASDEIRSDENLLASFAAGIIDAAAGRLSNCEYDTPSEKAAYLSGHAAHTN